MEVSNFERMNRASALSTLVKKTIEKWTPGQHQNPLRGKLCMGGGQTRITIENNVGDGGEVGD